MLARWLNSLPAVALIASAQAFLSGCSGPTIKTYPVAGKVQITDGDTSLLAGSHVELLHDTDQALRPSGKIAPSGDFKLETLYQGRILPAAPEGTYKARIILADESDEGGPKRKGDPIHRRYYNFQTSGLTFKVPGGDYNLSLSRK